MKRLLLFVITLIFISHLPAQNLVVNPDAESLPRGTGWTVISQGAATCLLIPTNNMLNWTMKPNGTANYPFDHTTGALGGTIFFSGCDTYLTGPFELQQTIDVSADSGSIDAGIQLYIFSGYIQTPVSNQSDRGRFIVDFLTASNTVLGASYASNWQSEFGGSGIAWNQYTNTRTAPVGTRKIRIRMQTQLFLNQPAINVYFDDISLTKPTVVPLGLLSFTGYEASGKIQLNWVMNSENKCKQFELERSEDATNFNRIAALTATGILNYHFEDGDISSPANKYFYRLKMKGPDGTIAYSNIIKINIATKLIFSLSPNPANDVVVVNGLSQPGILSVMDHKGVTLLTSNTMSSSARLDVSNLPAGIYIIRFTDKINVSGRRLVIQH